MIDSLRSSGDVPRIPMYEQENQGTAGPLGAMHANGSSLSPFWEIRLEDGKGVILRCIAKAFVRIGNVQTGV
jgi:uncharacterized membrane protein